MLARLLFLFLFAGSLQAKDLPAGIIACKDDANLNACADKASVAVIKNIVKGDRKFKIPVMDPLYIERIAVIDTSGRSVTLNLTLEHINIYGLPNTTLKSQMDTKKKLLKWQFNGKQLRILSDYEISGKFLLVPITGKGKSTINIFEQQFVFTGEYDLEDRKGKKYMVLKTPTTLTFEPKKATIHLENLFNGDKNLGENVNKMLNENWKELSDQLSPGIVKAINTILEDILKNILKVVPYDEFFPK